VAYVAGPATAAASAERAVPGASSRKLRGATDEWVGPPGGLSL
jgi:hypothetical protein